MKNAEKSFSSVDELINFLIEKPFIDDFTQVYIFNSNNFKLLKKGQSPIPADTEFHNYSISEVFGYYCLKTDRNIFGSEEEYVIKVSESTLALDDVFFQPAWSMEPRKEGFHSLLLYSKENPTITVKKLKRAK